MAGEIIRPSALPDRPNPVASEKVPVDNGVTVGGATIQSIVLAGRPTATQPEAEAGTDPTKAMTPLTTKQAIQSQGDVRFASAAQGAKADSALQSIVAGDNVSVDASDPQNPIVSARGGGGPDGKTFASIVEAQDYHPATAPDFLEVAGRASATDLGFFADRPVLYAKEAAEPSHDAKFSITLASSAVTWYGFRGKQIVPELFGPPSDAAGPIQDCIDYLSDGDGLTASNGGIIQLGEATYDIGTTTILYKSNVKLRGLGRSTNADGLLSRILYSGADVAFKPSDPTKQLEHVEVSDLMIFAPNTAVGIFQAQSTKWLDFKRNWLYGGSAGPKGLLVRPYFTKRNISGISKANPGVVLATAHGFADGTPIVIQGVSGMTQVNGLFAIVKNPTANTFELYNGASPINTTSFGTYTSGGQAIRFDTDPTYARIEDNYFGGVSWGIDMRDANASIVRGNRVQPNASGIGIYFGTEGPIPHSMNQSTIQANSVEANGTGIVAYQFAPTAYGFDVTGNRVELPNTGTIGFYAEPGAERIHLAGNYTSGVATKMLDASYAFYGDDPVFRNVAAHIAGASGSLLGTANRNIASTSRTGAGVYAVAFAEALTDVERYQVSISISGSIASAFFTNFTTSSITINVNALSTGAAVDPTDVRLEIRAR